MKGRGNATLLNCVHDIVRDDIVNIRKCDYSIKLFRVKIQRIIVRPCPGHSLRAPSLRRHLASLSDLPQGGPPQISNPLIEHVILEDARSVSGVEAILLPALRERWSEPAGLVDEVTQRLAGKKPPAIVEDDLVAPLV